MSCCRPGNTYAKGDDLSIDVVRCGIKRYEIVHEGNIFAKHEGSRDLFNGVVGKSSD